MSTIENWRSKSNNISKSYSPRGNIRTLDRLRNSSDFGVESQKYSSRSCGSKGQSGNLIKSRQITQKCGRHNSTNGYGNNYNKTSRHTHLIKTTIKNLNLECVKPQRGGVIIYTVVNGSIYFGLGLDSRTHDLTDFGGGIIYKTDRNVVIGALREFNEETLDIFEPITIDDIKQCPVIYDDNNLVIFIHMNIDPDTTCLAFSEKYKKISSPKICSTNTKDISTIPNSFSTTNKISKISNIEIIDNLPGVTNKTSNVEIIDNLSDVTNKTSNVEIIDDLPDVINKTFNVEIMDNPPDVTNKTSNIEIIDNLSDVTNNTSNVGNINNSPDIINKISNSESSIDITNYICMDNDPNPNGLIDNMTDIGNNFITDNMCIDKISRVDTINNISNEKIRRNVSHNRCLHRKSNNKQEPEVCGITWLTWEEFQYNIKEKGVLFSRVQRFLLRAGDFSYLL